MSAAQPDERPRTVTILGWAFLVVAVLAFLRSAINLLILAVLESQASELLARLNAVARPWAPDWVLHHADAIYACQAALALLVGVSAWGLLALKPWARLALESLSWVLLSLDAAFAAIWIRIWTGGRVPVSPGLPSAASHHTQILYLGLAIFGIWAFLFGVTLYFLRSAPVRLAFAPRSVPASG